MSARSRDQERAVYAYARAAEVLPAGRDAYKAAARGFGANVMRLGLSGALAVLERERERERDQHLSGVGDYLDALAGSGITGIIGNAGDAGAAEDAEPTAATLPYLVRALETAEYVLITRELLRVATWLKRAAEATFNAPENGASGAGGDDGSGGAGGDHANGADRAGGAGGAGGRTGGR